jgi:hypothetical protein
MKISNPARGEMSKSNRERYVVSTTRKAKSSSLGPYETYARPLALRRNADMIMHSLKVARETFKVCDVVGKLNKCTNETNEFSL